MSGNGSNNAAGSSGSNRAPPQPTPGPSQPRATPSLARGATPSPYGTLSQSTPPTMTSASSLFRKTDYSAGGGKVMGKVQFTPKLDAAKRAPPPKKEPAPKPKADKGDDSKPKRPRGRPPKAEMTASGAFSAGPSMAPPKERASAGGSGGGGGGSSSSKPAAPKADAPPAIAPEVLDYDSSDDDLDSGKKLMQIDKIHLRTDVYPPLNLPSAPKPVKEVPGKRKEEDNAAIDVDQQLANVSTRLPTPPPPVTSREGELKQEMADFLARDIKEEEIHVFQFPRTFPTFRDPNATEEPVETKPIIHKEAINASQYLAGGWEGFGKRATRKDRPLMGGSKNLSGKVGALQVLEDGSVRMVFGDPDEPDLVYDVLPAATPSFLQELAVISTEKSNLYVPMPKTEASGDVKPATEAGPSMLIMGSVERKFIVRPDVPTLLAELAIEDKKREEERKEAEEKKKAEEAKPKEEPSSPAKEIKPATKTAKPKASTSSAKASTSKTSSTKPATTKTKTTKK